MTLIEVLVAMGLFGLLSSLLLGLAISTSAVTDTTKATVDLNEQARVALERLSRELREASAVNAVWSRAGDFIGIEFEGDFNGDGMINGTPDTGATAAAASPTATMSADPDPEVVIYRWDDQAAELTLTDGSVADHVSEPILAGQVAGFRLELWSSRRIAGLPVTSSGTPWSALGAGAAPDDDSRWAPTQLAWVDRVSIHLSVRSDGRVRQYDTDVNLRNARVQQEQ